MPSHSSRAIGFVIAVLLVAALVPEAAAQAVAQPRAGAPAQWHLLGQTSANLTADHDLIVIRGPFDNFHRIKFKVTGAPLLLKLLVVTYDNGAPDRIEVGERIAEGGESRAIDLRGVGKRSVRKIEFWYDAAGVVRGEADVTVFGLR